MPSWGEVKLFFSSRPDLRDNSRTQKKARLRPGGKQVNRLGYSYYSRKTVFDELYRQERLVREAKILKEAGEASWGRDDEEEKMYRRSLQVIHVARREIFRLRSTLGTISWITSIRRPSARARRSPIRSAAKSGGDDGGGDDGGSDQGEPPKPPQNLRPIQAPLLAHKPHSEINHSSFPPLRGIRLGCWSMSGGWAS